MTTTIKYIGAASTYFESAVTGKQSVWKTGQIERREDAEALLLLGTGLFAIQGMDVAAVAAPVSGDISYLRNMSSGRASGIGQRKRSPRILKKFIDLANVTITPTGVTVTPSIDKNSPFGGPALKLTIAAAASGSVQIDLGDFNFSAFDQPVAASVWVDEANRVSSLGMWVSATAGGDFTNSVEYRRPFFAGGDKVGGPRVVWGGTGFGDTVSTNGTGFTMGTSALKSVRLKAVVSAGLDTVLWVKDIFIPAKQRPVVCFTFDDADVSWMTKLLPYLTATGVRATFGVYSSGINLGGAYITSADVQTLAAAGHQIACHNVNNYKLLGIGSTGNGEDAGVSTALSSVGYATEYSTCRQVLEALGVPAEGFDYHPWVQGGSETQAVALLQAAGVEVARTTVPYSWQPYGFPMGNNSMNLCAYPLSSSKTLAQCKTQIDYAVKYGGLVIFMGHIIAAAAAADTFAEADMAELLAYAASLDCDILTMHELADRLKQIGAMDTPSTNPSPPTRMIGRLIGANMNSTADQAITLPGGAWIITNVYATKPSTSLAASAAAGGLYTQAGKTGTTIVAAAQGYTALAAATDVVTMTQAATPTVTLSASGTGLYFALTTGHGSAATADIFVFGRPA